MQFVAVFVVLFLTFGVCSAHTGHHTCEYGEAGMSSYRRHGRCPHGTYRKLIERVNRWDPWAVCCRSSPMLGHGRCPHSPGLTAICRNKRERCKGDSYCRWGQVCCWEGCSRYCKNPVFTCTRDYDCSHGEVCCGGLCKTSCSGPTPCSTNHECSGSKVCCQNKCASQCH